MGIIALCLYIVSIMVRPQDWWDPVLDWQLVNVAAIAAVVTSAPEILGRVPHLWREVPELKIAVLVLLGVVTSYVSVGWLSGMIANFQEFGKVLIGYALVMVLTNNVTRYRIVLWTILGCILWFAVHGVLQYHTGQGFGPGEPFRRIREGLPDQVRIAAYGIFNDPNDLCLVFIYSLPLLWGESRTLRSPFLKALCWAMAALIFYAATLTQSRGGFLGILGVFITYVLLNSRGWKRWVLIAVAAAIVLVLAPARFASTIGGDRSRSANWGSGLAMFKEHKVLGIGYGQYAGESPERQVAHNSYIHVLTELGLVGYIPFFLLIFFSLSHLWRCIQYIPASAALDRIQLLSAFSGMSGFLLSCYFLSRQYNVVLYVILALGVSRVLISCREEQLFQQVFASNSRLNWRMGTGLALASVAVIWVTVRASNIL